MKILTNVSETRATHDWHKRTEFDPQLVGGQGFLSDIRAALRMIRKAKKYDLLVISSNRAGNFYAMIGAFLPFHNVPVLMIDCLWYRPSGKINQILKRAEYYLMNKSISKYVVWASHEIKDYAEVFHIPQEKIMYIPHHHTLEGYEYTVSDKGYIFSGGDGDRDYFTLIEAVKDLNLKVIIATRLKDIYQGRKVPANIEFFPTDTKDFRKIMAGARMVVVPMQKNLLHSGGQQSFLNAMAMGKPVVVADDCGATDYIKDGYNGLIVPSGDVDQLKQAILQILNDDEYAQKISENAIKALHEFSTESCMNNILKVAENMQKS